MCKCESIKNNFDERSAFYLNESKWASDLHLNRLAARFIEEYGVSGQSELEVLDYGAGPGALCNYLSEAGMSVDVADVSLKMLGKCGLAKRRWHIPNEKISKKYNFIILRQVLQYVREEDYPAFISELDDLLQPGGCLLFSQIVPRCNLDAGFWRDVLMARRPYRESFPDEAAYLDALSRFHHKVLSVCKGETDQSLKSWLSGADETIKQRVTEIIAARKPIVDSLCCFEETTDGDVTWRSQWLHVISRKS